MGDSTDNVIHVDDTVPGSSLRSGLILIAILFLGAILNLMNIQFGLPHVYGRNVEGRIVAIAVNAFVVGDLNPHTAIYPHLQLYLLLTAFIPYYLWGRISGIMTARADLLTIFQTDPTVLYTISRAVTALFGTGCIMMVYLIARRLYGKNIALVSSLIVSTFPLIVTNSHLVSPDVIMTFFILASFYYAIRITERGGFRDYFLCGAMLGLAFTAKYPAALAAVFVLLAHLLRKPSDNLSGKGGYTWSPLTLTVTVLSGITTIALGLSLDLSPLTLTLNRHFQLNSEKLIFWIRTLAVITGALLALLPLLTQKIRPFGSFFFSHRLFLSAICGCIVFIVIGSPYLLIDFHTTLNALLYHAHTESKPFWGSEETPVGWIYYLNLLRKGTSLPFVALFITGTVLLLYRHRNKDILILSFPILFYLFIGSFETKFPRYIIPIVPFLAIFAASIIDTVTCSDRMTNRNRIRQTITVLISLFAIPSLITSIQWDIMMGKIDTRTVARKWIESNIPPGSKIAIDALGPPLSRADFQLYSFYRGMLKPIKDLDPWGHFRLGEAKNIDILIEEEIQYTIVNSNAYGNYRRVPHLYPEEHAFYANLDSIGTLVKTFHPVDNPGPEILIYSIDPVTDDVKIEGRPLDSDR
jgi:hypothetical protein